jgi:ABC-2 type transport system ATP-binding protein
MRARLQLACAVLHQPPVLILDEPTASIDPVASYSLIETIQRLAREDQLAVLLSTHRADEIEALSANVALLDRGRLIHVGDLDELRARHEGVVELAFDGPAAARIAASHLRALPGVDSVTTHGASVELTTTLSAGRLLTSLDGALGSVEAVSGRPLPVRELLAAVLAEEAGAWE